MSALQQPCFELLGKSMAYCHIIITIILFWVNYDLYMFLVLLAPMPPGEKKHAYNINNT